MSILVWFRRDLRVQDNPALARAIKDGKTLRLPVIGVYAFDPEGVAGWAPGGASRWYLDRSLRSLQSQLADLGIPLHLKRGGISESVRTLAHRLRCERVYWNRVVEPGQAAVDDAVMRSLTQTGILPKAFDDDCLLMPEQMRRADGSPYRVFTPFWRRASEILESADFGERLVPAPQAVAEPLASDPEDVDRLGLLGTHPWHEKLEKHWSPGEAGALAQWSSFFGDAIVDYDNDRDIPGVPGTSRLSPALHLGEISVARVYAQCAERLASESDEGARASIRRYLSEIGWRDFSRHVLHAWPDSLNRSLDRRFDRPEAWQADPDGSRMHAWRRGETGFSLVDAGMRQLWESGWMHNRVRMVVASFLTKNLGIHWREGARWFWDTLVDADLPSNTLGWQWVAGCGTDAAPYYRIFNPDTQAEKFDPQHEYRSRWLGDGLRPAPMLDLKASRQQALSRYQVAIKGQAA